MTGYMSLFYLPQLNPGFDWVDRGLRILKAGPAIACGNSNNSNISSSSNH